MQPYTEFQYLWPPRPTRAVTPDQFEFFERRGWFAQLKLNGKCALIALGPQAPCNVGGHDDHVQLWNRHNEKLNWDMPITTYMTLCNLIEGRAPLTAWTVLVAELLHDKVSGGPKDTLYIHDVLVWRGEYLIGETYEQRYKRLRDRTVKLFVPGFDDSTPEKIAVLSEHVWLAAMVRATEPGTFGRMFDDINARQQARGGGSILTEGIVMKDPNAKLEPCTRESANDSWSAKCRLGTKNYAY